VSAKDRTKKVRYEEHRSISHWQKACNLQQVCEKKKKSLALAKEKRRGTENSGCIGDMPNGEKVRNTSGQRRQRPRKSKKGLPHAKKGVNAKGQWFGTSQERHRKKIGPKGKGRNQRYALVKELRKLFSQEGRRPMPGRRGLF